LSVFPLMRIAGQLSNAANRDLQRYGKDPNVDEIGGSGALAKSDRLEIHRDIRGCSKQVWPSFDRSCLRNGTAIKWRVIPLVVSDRNSALFAGQNPSQGGKPFEIGWCSINRTLTYLRRT
jgi:hypothetical protein